MYFFDIKLFINHYDMNNNRRRNFRGRQQKTVLEEDISSTHGSNGHFSK